MMQDSKELKNLKKLCNSCKKELSLQSFSKRKLSKDGLQANCKKCQSEYKKKWISKNPNYHKLKNKEWQKNNLDKFSKYSKKWRDKNKDKIREYFKEYSSIRESQDILFFLSKRLRNRIYKAFSRKKWHRDSSIKDILGCSLEEAKLHIESQFLKGMSWENKGEWHIDHKIPLIKATTKEELLKLCHYSNLQPLWAIDNLRKKDK